MCADVRSEFSLRRATDDDRDVIAGIWYRGWQDAHVGNVPDALLPHRTESHFPALVASRIPFTTVAVIDGAVVGFTTTREDELEQMYVAREARGLGVADALIRNAEESLARTVEEAWLGVVSGNARARRFYERSGWHDAGPFDYEAETSIGRIPVPCRRYVKRVR
jgi:ribosomal protein S18 acetylase RimI-like enzyme